MCNSYYAEVIGRDGSVLEEVVVRENSNYNPNASWNSSNYYRYYVSYKNSYYYFNMR